jgi:hypothetical protein
MNDREPRTRRRDGFTRTARVPRGMMVAVLGVLALWAVPAAANASPAWYYKGEQLTESRAVTWTGKVTLKFGTRAVSCKDTVSGKVGTTNKGPLGEKRPTGAGGEMKTWTLSGCVTLEGECTTPALEALGSPWTTELETIEGKIRNVLLPQTAKPGFEVWCGGHTFQECSKLPVELLTNIENDVSAEYNRKEEIECVEFKGHLEGSQEIRPNAGGVLEVK